MHHLHNQSMDRLLQAICRLETIEDCYAFFEDLCTVKEIEDMAQRLDTAVLLSEGMSYQKIAEQVGVSTATISRVNRCLHYGTGGYRKALDEMKNEENQDA